jgi:hypothetical protein
MKNRRFERKEHRKTLDEQSRLAARIMAENGIKNLNLYQNDCNYRGIIKKDKELTEKYNKTIKH